MAETSTIGKADVAGQRSVPPRSRLRRWGMVLAAVALVAVAGAFALRQHPAAARLTVTAVPGSPDADVPRMTVATAKQLVDSGQAVLLDVRGSEYYAQLHAAGAASLPYDEVEQRLAALPTDKWLILYCT